uniref:Occludin/ELL domain-containing protein 1 isoform X1 n=1 Tax=Callorhinus ursinus TaxID=34884 RepID=A0A3Q7Q4X8_CALUR|nr:occludin/ELL domain-containing protein 1 isoform X1 [Callorhinus ursinus]
MHNPDSGASPAADPGSETRTLGQVAPDRSGPCGPQLGQRSRGTSRGRCPWASRVLAGEAAAARGLTGGGPTQDTRWRHGRRAFPGYAARGGLLWEPMECVYANSCGASALARRWRVGRSGLRLLVGPPGFPASRRTFLWCPQAARRPPPPGGDRGAPRRTRPPPRGRPSGASLRPMPTRESSKTRGYRGDLQTRPPGPGPPRLVPPGPETSAPRALCERQPGAHRARPKKIVFEDELPSRALLSTRKPIEAIPRGHMPRAHPVPDYELKYPQVSSERERSGYAAVFQDQYTEFVELQQEVGSALAKLQQLETLLTSLPRPRSQKEAQVAARVWREFEKKQTDPSFLDKQARCHYLKGKLRHLKMQIQKFDEQGDFEGSVYF